MQNLVSVLDGMTVEGELAQTLPDGSVRCFACGHRCLIREGRRGICQVRFNRGGKLRVPWGYVAALQADPVEKKPFYHLRPGSIALTFGMLGCDFHCGFCFTGDTVVVTDRGPDTFENLFAAATRKDRTHAEIAYPDQLQAVTRSGGVNRVRAIFRHPYKGKLVLLKPYYLPALRLTPEHRVYATDDPAKPPRLMQAQELTLGHYLAIPRNYQFRDLAVIDVANQLGEHRAPHRISWKLKQQELKTILQASSTGSTSRQIGLMLDKDPSYVHQIRSKVARGKLNYERTAGCFLEEGSLRFPREHRPGIPQEIAMDERMAYLLGFYCAEGSVVAAKDRPNSYSLNFSLAPSEHEAAEKIRSLLAEVFQVTASLTRAETTLVVSTGKASVALLFMTLAGKGAQNKRVPGCIFEASRNVTRAFLDAYVSGDGHRYGNGKVSCNTVSPELAHGIAWLVLKTGNLVSIYETAMTETAFIQGSQVRRSPVQFTLVWYESAPNWRKAITTPDFHLVPLKAIGSEDFDGFVYNMEVDQNHNYLAGFFLVSNCQNWLTSQAGRDPAADESLNLIHRITPEQVVETGRRAGAQVIASSYNEPLITSEWAAGVFKLANAAGMKCVYVSNGNGTPEVLDYIRPYLVGYKVDLKSMNDRHYRELGGVLQNVLDTIQRAHDLGLWVEVVTLVIPGFNDGTEELWEAARFLAGVSADIPWHVTAFHQDYKMTDPENTPARTLLRAAEIGREAGLHYVYAGNLPGRVEEYEDTFCPRCGAAVIRRRGYFIQANRITPQGTCPDCGARLAGVW